MLILKIIIFSTNNVKKTLKAHDNCNFLTLEAKLAFLQLKEKFIKISILHYFDLEQYIWIKIDAFSYAIDFILSKLIPKSDECYLMVFFFEEIILIETWYKTHN